MFPVDLSGSIRVRSQDADAILQTLADMADAGGAVEVWVEPEEVRFRTGLLVGSRWDVLVPFNSGTLRVEAEGTSSRVRFRFSTLRLLLIVTALTGLLGGGIAWHNYATNDDWQTPLRIFAAGWAWLFGMNYLLGAIRVPFWLKRGLRKLT